MPGQGREPGDVVADAAAGVERRALVVGHLHREPGAGPERPDVVGGTVPLVAAQPVAADAAVHETRVAFDRGRRLEAEPVEGVRAEVADEDVGGGEQLFETLPAVGLPQVEHHAALAPVVEREGRVRHVAVDAQRPEHLAHRIAGRCFDLDHVGAPVGQQGGRRRSGDPDAQLHDPQVGERREPRRRVGAHPSTPERRGTTRSRSSVLDDLPGGVDRQLVDQLHGPGDLVIGHLVAAPVDDGGARRRRRTGERRRPCRPRRGARPGRRSRRPAATSGCRRRMFSISAG